MAVWKIEPAAPPTDARWLDYGRWDEVRVRAPTPGQARLAAAEMERLGAPSGVGNESAAFRSGFEDEKLYWVRQVEDERASGEEEDYPAVTLPVVLSARRADRS